MSVSLSGAEGFYTRVGVFAGEYNRVAALYGSGLTNGFQSVWGQFASTDQAAVENLPTAVSAFRQSAVSYQSTLNADAQIAALLQVARDTSVVPYSVAQAFTVVKGQMVAAGASINRPAVVGTVTPGGSNEGDTLVVASATNVYGDPIDAVYAETITLTATQSGTGFTGTVAAVGATSVPVTAYNWPAGSGCSASVPITDAATGSLLTDGNFANWEGTGDNTPSNWDIVNGAAGTTVFQNSGGGVRTGTNAAKITSDGSQTTQLSQAVTLATNTVYAATFTAKINTTTATGTFRLALTDGAGTLLADDAGADLSYTLGVNGGAGIGTSYAQFTVFFSTPRQLPETVNLRIGTSVAATAAREISFCLVALVAATPLYGIAGTGTSGPFVAAFASTLASATGDTWSLAYTNSLGTRSFVWGQERLFNLKNSGVYMPSSGSPTIADSLVTS